MTTDIATRLGTTLIGAIAPAQTSTRLVATAAERPGVAKRLLTTLFGMPVRFVAWLERRQAARDALVRYAMSEGKLGVGRNEIERAVLLTGRADMLFPSYFVNADRR